MQVQGCDLRQPSEEHTVEATIAQPRIAILAGMEAGHRYTPEGRLPALIVRFPDFALPPAHSAHL